MPEVKSESQTKTIDIADFLENGILREKSFREKIKRINWAKYLNQKVILKGCNNPVPIWAYLIIATHLTPYAKRIFWGEPCSTVPIYVKPS